MNAVVQPLPREIRGVMLPVTGAKVLVPSTTMAEVITYAHPAPVDGAPAWLLGRSTWRGWNVPIVSLTVLGGTTRAEPTENTRVAILKALGGNPRLPYFGILCQGFPRLTLIDADTLVVDPPALGLPVGVSAQVKVRDDTAWIPDLAMIEGLVIAALGTN